MLKRLHTSNITPCVVRVEWDESSQRPVHLYIDYHFLSLQKSPSGVNLM